MGNHFNHPVLTKMTEKSDSKLTPSASLHKIYRAPLGLGAVQDFKHRFLKYWDIYAQVFGAVARKGNRTEERRRTNKEERFVE